MAAAPLKSPFAHVPSLLPAVDHLRVARELQRPGFHLDVRHLLAFVSRPPHELLLAPRRQALASATVSNIAGLLVPLRTPFLTVSPPRARSRASIRPPPRPVARDVSLRRPRRGGDSPICTIARRRRPDGGKTRCRERRSVGAGWRSRSHGPCARGTGSGVRVLGADDPRPDTSGGPR